MHNLNAYKTQKIISETENTGKMCGMGVSKKKANQRQEILAVHSNMN